MKDQMPQQAAGEAPRRIALVSDWCAPRRGGIEVHIVSLARYLRAAGADARIVTSFPGPAQVDGVDVERVSTPLLPGAHLAVSPWLVGIAARQLIGRYDLVHLHASQVAPFCLATAIAAMRAGIPVVVTFHSFMGILPHLLEMAEWWWGWSKGKVAITAVSSLVARQITDIMPSLPVSILPNGYDPGIWHGVASRRASGPLRVVSAMRLQARKRPRAVVDIFARACELTAGRAGIKLTLAGEGAEMPALRRRIRRLGLEQTVDLTGWLGAHELHALYGECNLFLMPSTKEAFCIAALEARASGLPVLAMAKTGVAEFIANGVSGELAGDDEDMAWRLARLALDRDRLDRLADNDGGIARHEWPRLARQHLDLYREVFAGSAAANSRT